MLIEISGLNQHWVRRKGRYVQKKAYETLSDANDYLDSNPKLKEKYNPYICSICGKYHIGHIHKKK